MDEKWNAFMQSGKISDYLDYKSAERQYTQKAGEGCGNCNISGNSTQGISCRGQR